MASSRRRFLSGAAALAASIAGCNGSSSSSSPVTETVTPVAVPRTDEEVLAEAADVDVPSVPSPILVSDDHFAAAVEQVETLRESLVERLDATDEPVRLDGRVRTAPTPEAVVENVDERLDSARETGPSEEALATLRQALEEAATADGYLRAANGDVDLDALVEGLDAEQAAQRELRERIDYRIADPLDEYLPTAFAAEAALVEIDALRFSGTLLTDIDPEDEQRFDEIANAHRHLEYHRRRRDDAERFLETATDPDAPSVRRAITDELDAVREELAAVVEEYGDDDPPDRGTVAGEIRAVRWTVGSRCEQVLASLPDHREDGRRLFGLLDAIEQLIEFRAIDAAVERTVSRLDDGEFPAERILEEKRRAVERIEGAAVAPALRRQFVTIAPQILRSGDGSLQPDAGDVRPLARAHLLYAGAGEIAERGLERGEALGETLQAQQS